MTMYLFLEIEVRSYTQFEPQNSSRDRLYMGFNIQTRKSVNTMVDAFTHTREADKLTNCMRFEVIKTIPRKFLTLNSLDNTWGDAAKLPERRLSSPHPMLNHVAQVECL
mmetsp:Transcript_28950/g.40339  ORF Transcript_28950/g.40339 Transcript_28950/m.40339 type:complete len:109 (-) Transcript_28950:303-629(-)